MKAVIVFLVGVAVGWMLAPRLVPELVAELEPIEPELGKHEAFLETSWLWMGRDGTVTWTRPN